MTDKPLYVPLDVVEGATRTAFGRRGQWGLGEALDTVRAAAVALRVAGPDDAIVNREALRVGRRLRKTDVEGAKQR